MGSGASRHLAVALAGTPEDELASVLAGIPEEQCLRLQSALGVVERAGGTETVDTLEVQVSALSGEVVGELAMPRTATVTQLKLWLSGQGAARTHMSRQCLLLGHQIVSDADVLSDLVSAESPGKLALHLVRKHRKVVRGAQQPSSDDGHKLAFKRFKVVLIGDEAVGKSSIITRFLGEEFSPCYKATIGIDFLSTTAVVDDLARVRLTFWDTSGQERFRPLLPSYCRDASYIFLVFDVTARGSFERLPQYVDNAAMWVPPDALTLIIGSKADQVDCRQVSEEEAVAFAAKLGLTYSGVSARTGANIEAIFHDMCSMLADQVESMQG